MNKFVININGELFSEDNAKISVLDRGFLYGDSVYEATRTFNFHPFRLNQHLERLFNSAHKIDLIPSFSKEKIHELVLQTVKESPHSNQALRIVLTRGTNCDLGLNPNLANENNLIIFSKEISENPSAWLIDGVDAIFYQKLSTQKGSLSKTGNYQENLRAYRQALEAQAFEAIMINPDGEVTEGTTSNIWLIKKGMILTPTLDSGVLEGLSRRALFELARRDNLPIKEAILTKQDFLSADECFLTSTTRNLVPITKIENQLIGNGKPGPKTLELLKSYLEFVSSR